jgi:putative transposase
MRRKRLLLAAGEGVCAYHCISRVLEQKFVLDTNEKEIFVAVMRAQEAFSGVRVLTYCIMDNHFHILVEVPNRPIVRPGAEELLARQALVCSKDFMEKSREHYDMLMREHREGEAEAMLEGIWRRMYDLSWFMHGVKGRFTQGFNARHKRKGTLWEQRFQSVVVESGRALQTMAAYIDLNPIRAGIVKKPEDYRWCGFAEATIGLKEAVAGLTRLMTLAQEPEVAAKFVFANDVLAPYRDLFYGQGMEIRDDDGKVRRKGLTEEEIRRVEASIGAVSVLETMKRKVSWLSTGLVLGSKAFVQEVYQSVREKVGWRRAQRKVSEKEGLCVLGAGFRVSSTAWYAAIRGLPRKPGPIRQEFDSPLDHFPV